MRFNRNRGKLSKRILAMGLVLVMSGGLLELSTLPVTAQTTESLIMESQTTEPQDTESQVTELQTTPQETASQAEEPQETDPQTEDASKTGASTDQTEKEPETEIEIETETETNLPQEDPEEESIDSESLPAPLIMLTSENNSTPVANESHVHHWTYMATGYTNFIACVCDDVDGKCPYSNAQITINGSNSPYDGQEREIRAEVTAILKGDSHVYPIDPTTDGITLADIVYQRDGTVITGKPVNAGEYWGYMTINGAKARAQILISKATPIVAQPITPSAITYGDALSDSELKNGKMQLSESDSTEVPGTFTWKDGNIHPTVANSQKTEYPILFTPTDQVNHESVELKSTLYVMPAPNAPNLPGRVRNVSNSVTKVGDVTLPADWAWKSSDKESELEIGVTITATAEYTGADKGNYRTESVTVSITRDGCEHVPEDIFFTGSGEHAPTCTVDGLGHRECDICHKLIESDVIVKAAHKFSTDWTIDVNATTTSEGSKSHHCTVCDAKTDITAIPRIPASGGGSSGNESDNIDDTANISTDSTQNNTESGTVVADVVTPPAISIPNPKTVAVLPEIKPTVPTHEPSNRKTSIAALINDEIPAQPFLQSADGKEGWEVITSELADTKAGTTFAIDMNGTSVVPGNIFKEIRGKDITIEFDLGNGIIWKVNGQSVQTDNIRNVDFAVRFGEDANDTIPVEVINNLTGERVYMNLSLAYDGPFGFDAVLTVNMGSNNTGLFANLFYYNEETGELEFICAGEVREDGNVELTFNHASEYTIVIDSQSMDQAAADTVLENESDDSTPAAGAVDDIDQSVTPTTVNDTSTSYTWIIFLAVAAIAVVVVVLVIKRRKK